MEGRQAFVVSLFSIGIFLAIVILAVGALRGNWTLAVALAGLVAWLMIEPGAWILLHENLTDDRKPPEQNDKDTRSSDA